MKTSKKPTRAELIDALDTVVGTIGAPYTNVKAMDGCPLNEGTVALICRILREAKR